MNPLKRMKSGAIVARLSLCALLSLLSTAPAAAQHAVVTEADVTGGYSTEKARTASTQVRVFGDAPGGWDFFLEGAWGGVGGLSSLTSPDAFGAAYPYDGRPHAMELYAEKIGRPNGRVAAVRLGRYRTPFGISGRSDHAYNGFLRAPLIRYDDYFALSNTFMEVGVDVVAGTPYLQAEASLGVPRDEGAARRRNGLDPVVRIQGNVRDLIVGASYIRTQPYQPIRFARGHAAFGGVDVRWMRSGVQVRGEWLRGRPFDGTTTDGWYVDGIVHVRRMGPVSAVARVERMLYSAGPRTMAARRVTGGARIRLPGGFAATINAIKQPIGTRFSEKSTVDVALTYSLRRGR